MVDGAYIFELGGVEIMKQASPLTELVCIKLNRK
jgi:hypothetical protein